MKEITTTFNGNNNQPTTFTSNTGELEISTVGGLEIKSLLPPEVRLSQIYLDCL